MTGIYYIIYIQLYIMQNTMGWGKWPAGEKKIKLGVREKNEKGKEKRRKITLKKREKALKMHLFGL